jgi:hypothetical protein
MSISKGPTRPLGFLSLAKKGRSMLRPYKAWELSRGVHLMFLCAAKTDLSCARGFLLLQS